MNDGLPPPHLIDIIRDVSQSVTFQIVREIKKQHESLQYSVDRLLNMVLNQELRAIDDGDLPRVALRTDYPVAVQSDDHKTPLGARQDNTHYPRFVRRCEQIFRRSLRALDLGCAGGGLVMDFVTRGHLAIGLEGSDYPRRHARGEWPILPQNLFTCDISKPFQLIDTVDDSPCKFDVISMWEVLEHMELSQLSGLFDNVLKHLAPQGIFVASVATFECEDVATGAVYHRLIEAKPWWHEQAKRYGFTLCEDLFTTLDFPRGSGNGPNDWSAERDPHLGFHLVLRKQQ